MQMMTIEEAASFFGVSKEAIHNRIRRKTLSSTVKNGIKYVYVDATTKHTAQTTRTDRKSQDRFYAYLQEQNKELAKKIEKLEEETRKLREDKERMLIEERKRIEQIYKEKDEQLKNVLQAISSKLLPHSPPSHTHEPFEAEFAETKRQTERISAKKFLKQFGYKKKKRKKILQKIKKIALNDDRFVIEDDGKVFLFPSYSYEDICD